MKNIKKYILIVLFASTGPLYSQEAGKAIHQAMENEISRNLKGLHLEGMKDPFYIGLNVVDFNMLSVYSSLGALVRISESPYRYAFNNQVLVGDYNNNNLNYTDSRAATYYMRTFSSLPLDNSVSEIQRKLWMMLDRSYKLSAEIYESKQSALQTTTQTEDIAGVPDFLKGEKVMVEKPEISLKYNNDALINYSNEISLALKSYKYLTTSWVRVVCYKANVYFSNSEGSKATYPVSLLRVVVNVETRGSNDEILELYNTYHSLNESDLPPKDLVIKEAKAMAEMLARLRAAPVFDDVYTGPVLFEDQASSEAVRKTMFYAKNENLFSARKQITGNTPTGQVQQNKISTDDRIGKKVAAIELNVKARPALTTYNGVPLVGSYPVDMEGTIPPQEIVLIENGMLKSLLGGRVPTAKMTASNGHLRVPVTVPNPLIVPSVIDVDFTNSLPKEDLKKKLIELAQAEGLDYALIVRQMTPNQSEIREVYKVDVKTGAESLVRSASFKGLVLNDLRKLVGTSNQKRVLNTTAGEDIQHKFDFLGGCPATFITPDALLFKEIEVTRVVRTTVNKPPIVKNPLEL
jgi:hypothetical protein